ncbi:MAG: hypothetical protein E6J91_06325, partial [Deltaproteobacteria bacterium]
MRRLNAAYAALAAARAELAAASVVGQLPARGHAHAALTAHRDRLLAMPGVLGVGLGVGAARQPMISVFVRSDGADDRNMWDELSGAQLRVAGRGIGVEVVPFGGLKPVPQPVSVAGGPDQRKAAKAMRLAPGDGIGQVDPATRATLGAFAVTADQAPVAITAMHMVGASEVEPGDQPIDVVRRVSIDDQGIRIGAIDRGTLTRVDAARILLDDGIETTSDV